MNATTTDVADLGTILSVWAHPDDETYLAGGVMAAAADRGQRVVCVAATAGEHGTGDPDTWPPLRLGRLRYWEAAAAMAVLGVSEHRFLGLPDGGLIEWDATGQALVGDLLDEVRPDTILTFGPDGMTYHPDHITISRWVTEAWQQRDRPCRLLYATTTVEHAAEFGELYEQWNMYMSDERPTGVPAGELALHAALDGAALDRKLAALAAMASQTRDLTAMVGAELYARQVREEGFVDAPLVADGVRVETQDGRARTAAPTR
ncbi:MAG: PIG-L family deacetylase [Ilumatobacteraceae bacterium]